MFGDAGRVRKAFVVCGQCPVLWLCRAWALRHAVDGVAGGGYLVRLRTHAEPIGHDRSALSAQRLSARDQVIDRFFV